VSRILSTDESERMPPSDSQKKLTDEQKALLKRWIEQAAPYAEHWSFVAPKKAPLPAVSKSDWVKNEIDRFILARLDTEGLPPSPPADSRTLVRRLSLDLTGLPPSADEVEAFATDTSDRAIEQLVDRLLKSPH